MHWRTPFPPKRPSVLAEILAVFRKSFAAEAAVPLPDELPPAEATVPAAPGGVLEPSTNG